MSVIRVSHQNNPVAIDKTALEDPNLSFKAKGLWSYLMSRHFDWKFNLSELQKASTEGKTAILSALKELEDAGYYQIGKKK